LKRNFFFELGRTWPNHFGLGRRCQPIKQWPSPMFTCNVNSGEEDVEEEGGGGGGGGGEGEGRRLTTVAHGAASGGGGGRTQLLAMMVLTISSPIFFYFSLPFFFLFPLWVLSSLSLFCSSLFSLYSSLFFFTLFSFSSSSVFFSFLSLSWFFIIFSASFFFGLPPSLVLSLSLYPCLPCIYRRKTGGREAGVATVQPPQKPLEGHIPSVFHRPVVADESEFMQVGLWSASFWCLEREG